MRLTTASTGKSTGNVSEEPDGWAHSQVDRKTQSASTHLDAPGLQLLFYSAQVQGDRCTGIVDPEDCEDLAIVQLCKQIQRIMDQARAPLEEFRTEGITPSHDEEHGSRSASLRT